MLAVRQWWTLELLHEVFDGFTEPDEIRENLGLSDEVLAERLDALEERGLLARRDDGRYEATELGWSLRPVILAMAAWGNRGLAAHERSLILVDAATGAEVEPVVVDSVSGVRVDSEAFRFTAGPVASEPLRLKYRKKGLSHGSGEAAPPRHSA
ncbi:helix-turn-helix transcriptional regulator [Streptomyces sp. 205]|uniref:Helix-turn-helix transcriptional regulator n=1 Tax=Streptomyces coffeae TaxID=621382 RepID=A0ABS1NCW5_9ACTN|nr:helix-turn-helix transcriptional regulator [Streptomyces coffeae]